MDSRRKFFDIIFDHYVHASAGKIPDIQLNELSEIIADHYYEQYQRFGEKYPKSAKRYSTFQVKDLDHPYTYERVIKFFKNKNIENYTEYCMQLLNMNYEALIEFEKNRENFYKMW